MTKVEIGHREASRKKKGVRELFIHCKIISKN
jgi:hypothetical protein